ncbi:MAG: hypothetical protein GY797_40950 [Deltaproteobacteria bacterium]|nr:hypothetical protein [Deltaproteobacteria bacterium]
MHITFTGFKSKDLKWLNVAIDFPASYIDEDFRNSELVDQFIQVDLLPKENRYLLKALLLKLL